MTNYTPEEVTFYKYPSVAFKVSSYEGYCAGPVAVIDKVTTPCNLYEWMTGSSPPPPSGPMVVYHDWSNPNSAGFPPMDINDFNDTEVYVSSYELFSDQRDTIKNSGQAVAAVLSAVRVLSAVALLVAVL